MDVFEEAQKLSEFDADTYHWKGQCYFAMQEYAKVTNPFPAAT